MKRRACFALLLIAVSTSVFAYDFGLSLDAEPKYGNEDGFELSATATPWFSTLVGERGSLFLSADCTLNVTDSDSTFEFDVRRFEYRLLAENGVLWDFGRFSVQDPSGVVVAGLLDGVRGELHTDIGAFRFGAYYTGLLNKDKNYIYLSGDDFADMADTDRFFAPSRLIAAAAYERPNLFRDATLAVELLGQFDLRADGSDLHSQYLIAGLNGPISPGLFYKAFLVASVVEETGESLAMTAAFAADVAWLPSGGRSDKVYGQLRWGSGARDTGGSAFVPVTANPQGVVFDPKLAGLLTAKGGYAVRLSPTVAVDASATAFFKTGDGVSDSELDYYSDSFWLGAEAFGTLRVAPVSDISLSLGLGIFLPNTGGAFVSDAAPRWLATGAVLISL